MKSDEGGHELGMFVPGMNLEISNAMAEAASHMSKYHDDDTHAKHFSRYWGASPCKISFLMWLHNKLNSLAQMNFCYILNFLILIFSSQSEDIKLMKTSFKIVPDRRKEYLVPIGNRYPRSPDQDLMTSLLMFETLELIL